MLKNVSWIDQLDFKKFLIPARVLIYMPMYGKINYLVKESEKCLTNKDNWNFQHPIQISLQFTRSFGFVSMYNREGNLSSAVARNLIRMLIYDSSPEL